MGLVVVSWTNTVHAIRHGLLTLEQIKEADFYFSCKKEHVLTEGLIPYEATWANKQLPTFTNPAKGTSSVLEMVDEPHRQLVADLIALLKQADAEGRIFWQLGNQPEFIEGLPDDTPVFYNRYLGTAKDFKPN